MLMRAFENSEARTNIVDINYRTKNLVNINEDNVFAN